MLCFDLLDNGEIVIRNGYKKFSKSSLSFTYQFIKVAWWAVLKEPFIPVREKLALSNSNLSTAHHIIL